jgi:hypothetical protein
VKSHFVRPDSDEVGRGLLRGLDDDRQSLMAFILALRAIVLFWLAFAKASG